MKNRFIFFGKAERSVLVVLALLATSGLLLLGREVSSGQTASQPPNPTEASNRETTAANTPTNADSIHRSPNYAGPPEYLRHQSSSPKLKAGSIVDLNSADSALLVRVPGIGPAFSRRIIRLRERLGGFYTVLQLQEVYGMDEDKFLELRRWFSIQTPPRRYRLEELNADNLPKHLYLSYEHQKALRRLIHRHGTIKRWSTLMREGSFSRDDSIRLCHYFLQSPKGEEVNEEE